MDKNYITQLRAILEAAGWSQQELAAQLGVTHPALSRWLNNHAIPQPRRLQAIAALYKERVGYRPLTREERARSLAKARSLRIRGLWRTLRGRRELVDELLLEHTYNSNAIEGSTLTKRQTEAILFHTAHVPDKSLIEHLEVTNHAAALREILMGQYTPLISEHVIRQLHHALMQGIREDAGQYSKHHRAIRGVNLALTHPKDIPEEMAGLLKAWRRTARRSYGIEEVARFHADFEMIHPFGDGNGRVGRLVMGIQLLARDYPPAIIENAKKAEYYDVLEYAQRRSVEPLTMFLIEAMERTRAVLRRAHRHRLD